MTDSNHSKEIARAFYESYNEKDLDASWEK